MSLFFGQLPLKLPLPAAERWSATDWMRTSVHVTAGEVSDATSYSALKDDQPTSGYASPLRKEADISPRQHVRPRWFFVPWRYQLLSWFGGLCFFVGIVVLLCILDGRPLPDFEMGITPNALVGLFATLMEFLLVVPVSTAL